MQAILVKEVQDIQIKYYMCAPKEGLAMKGGQLVTHMQLKAPKCLILSNNKL